MFTWSADLSGQFNTDFNLQLFHVTTHLFDITSSLYVVKNHPINIHVCQYDGVRQLGNDYIKTARSFSFKRAGSEYTIRNAGTALYLFVNIL